MYLTELKEEYPLVYKSLMEQTYLSPLDIENIYMSVMGALVWSNTKEGTNFWSAVHSKKWDKAKSLQPHLFEEEDDDDKPIKIIVNGLFKN